MQTLHLTGTPHEPLTALEAGGAGSNLPTRIRLLAWGDNPSVKGNMRVGKLTLEALPANQARYGFELVALDFGHNTVPGTQAYKESQEPRPVAAYGKPQVVEGEGLFLTDLDWTPEGVKNAANYRDVSATVNQDPSTGEILFLHSAAICRQGAVPGMELVAASVELAEKKPTAAAPKLTVLDAEAMAAVVDAVGSQLRDAEWRKRDLEELRGALEREQQRNAALQTTVEALVEQIAALKASLEAATAASAPLATLTALSADVATLRTAQATSADRHERELLLLTARTQGKLIPLSAEGLASTPLATLRDLVAQATPGAVPLGRLTPLHVSETPDASAQADATTREVARMCGVPPEAVADHARKNPRRSP